MAEQNRPASREQAPDPSHSYERSHPNREGGMGRMDNNDDAVPTESPDRQEQAVHNRQDPQRQINAHDDLPPQPDHSMREEEPDGWDQAPTNIKNPRMKRHPRTEGKGGTP